MPLSKYEQLRSKRERDFQRRVIEALEGRGSSAHEPTNGPFRRCVARLLKIINSGAFLASFGILVSFGVFYHHTYVACIADTRKFYRDYVALKMELFQRHADIAKSVYDAGSIAALKEALSHKRSFDPQFGEVTTAELQARFLSQTASIDMSGVGPDTARSVIEKADAFQSINRYYLPVLLMTNYRTMTSPF